MATDVEGAGAVKDPVMDFLQKFTLGSMRLKPDKWSRLMISDEMRNYISNFVERGLPQVNFKNTICINNSYTNTNPEITISF